MTTEVTVCNSALIHLGAGLITSLNDNTDEARACKQFFNGARDAVLESNYWRFATTQAALSKLTSTPLFGYTYAYQLPTDPYCIKPKLLEDEWLDTEWQIHGRTLVTDRDGVDLEYIFRQEDLSAWTPLAIVALEYFLAGRMAYTITGSRSVAADMFALFEEQLTNAQSSDSQVGYGEEFSSDSLITTRR